MHPSKTSSVLYALVLSSLILSALARHAHAEPARFAMVRIEIASNPGQGRHAEQFTLVVSESEPGEMRVALPGAGQTHLKLHLDHHGGPGSLSYEVDQSVADQQSFSVRGRIDVPAPGKRTVVAHLPLAGEAEAEVAMTVLPARD